MDTKHKSPTSLIQSALDDAWHEDWLYFSAWFASNEAIRAFQVLPDYQTVDRSPFLPAALQPDIPKNMVGAIVRGRYVIPVYIDENLSGAEWRLCSGKVQVSVGVDNA